MSKEVVSKPFTLRPPQRSARKTNSVRPGVAYSYLHHLLEEEKVQLARDLHDSLGQELTILKMGLAEIARANRRNIGVKSQCERLSGIVDHLVETVRQVCVDLHPSLLEEDGLFSTLEWYLARFAKQTGLPCRFQRIDEQPKIQPDKATQVFRIVQEALTNVARHAQAKSITVETVCKKREFTIEVRDDGIGVPEDKISDYRSIGLMNMKERARLIGGRLELSGSPGEGTSVRLAIPLDHCSAAFGTSENQEIVQSLNDALAEQFRLISRGKAIHKEIRALKRETQRFCAEATPRIGEIVLE